MEEEGGSAPRDPEGLASSQSSGSESENSGFPSTSHAGLMSLDQELANADLSGSGSDEAADRGNGNEPGRPPTPPSPDPNPFARPPSRGFSPPPLRFWGEEGLAEERRIKEEMGKKFAEEKKKRMELEAQRNPEKAPRDTFPTKSDLELARPIIGVLKQMARAHGVDGKLEDGILREAIHESATADQVNNAFARMLLGNHDMTEFVDIQTAAQRVPRSHGFSGDGSKLYQAIFDAMVVDTRTKQNHRDAQRKMEEGSQDAKETIKQLTGEKKGLEGQLKKLRDDAQESEEKMLSLRSEAGYLQQKLSECTDMVEEVRQQLTKEKKDLEEQLAKEKKDFEEQLKKFQDTSEESKDTIEKLTNEKEGLEAKLESDKQAFENSLENERKDLEEKLTKAQGESQKSAEMIQQLTDEKQDLEQKLKSGDEDAQSSSDTIRELTSEKLDLERKLKSCEDDAQSSRDTITQLTDENKALEAKLKKALEDDGSELLIRQLADEKANVEEELERCKNGANLKIQQLARDKEDLEEKLDNAGQNHENELESQKEALEKRLEALQAKYNKFINDVDEDRRTMMELHERSVENMNKLMAEYQATGEAVAKLEVERKEARSALEKYKAKNTKLREEIQVLRRELEDAKKGIDEGGGTVGSSGSTNTTKTTTSDTISSATQDGYNKLLEYYNRAEEALKIHKSNVEQGGQMLVQAGGKQANYDSYQANIMASYEKTKGHDGQVIEGFSELSEHLLSACIHIQADTLLLGSLDTMSAQFQKFDFPGPRTPRPRLSPNATIPQRLVEIPKRVVAIPQRLLGWANNLGLMPLINLFMFVFFLAATLAEGSKYAQWGRPNATSRAMFAENRAYACVSAPQMSFFYEMVRNVLGIPSSI
ncbi:hypothetical protein PG993_012134 [Apiospora rasikravindrae]|uniref:Uncharacterized protein n=1 Tax=Apiospora rasikravindrae TaxID=990691 RepID=A0ABR1S240_9PEZI